MMTESLPPPPAYHDFHQELNEGWNVTLEVCVKLQVYDKFFHLWRSGGYQNATDYLTHMLLLEEHNQNAFRSLNESDPHKEECLTMELSRQLLDIAESAKQQESPSATSSSQAEHDHPSSPLQTSPLQASSHQADGSPVALAAPDSQLPAPYVAHLPQQRITIPRIEPPSGEHCLALKTEPSLHNNGLLIQSVIQQVKMSDMPPLIPVSALVTPSGHLDQGYLVSGPPSNKSPQNHQLQPITDEEYADNETDFNGPSQVPPNSPSGTNSMNTPMPVLQKLPGIGELCKRPLTHMDNGFRTSPDHMLSPGGFQTSPLHQPSAPEVSSSCDSTSSTGRRPTRHKAEIAKQFIHTICSPDSLEDLDKSDSFNDGHNYNLDDFDESDYSDSEDSNNNSVKKKFSRTECETCQEIFLSDEYLMQHYYDNPGHKRHPGASQVFNCELCSQPMEGRHALMQHCRDSHPEYYKRKVEKLCTLCNVILPNKHALRQHLRTHELDLTICPERGCGRVIKRQHIAQHMTKVHGESQVSCDDCSKVFRNVLALKAHTQNVHKGFKYVCSFPGCHRSFKRPSTLKVHELIHKDFKPMKCKLCSFRCRQQASISHHFKQHHPGVKPGFVRQSEEQCKDPMQSPTKHLYGHPEFHSPVKQYMSPSPEMIPSPDMVSNGQYRMVMSSSQVSAEVC